jgi:hypothetical protein
MASRFPCPKCNRSLESTGEVVVESQTCPVYQCDECMVPWTVEGQEFETALTFAVGPDGKPFDPASDGGELLI